MNFRIGDKVKFLYDTGNGEISAIIDKEKVMVRTGDGFDIPVLARELVRYGDEENQKLSGTEDDEPRNKKAETVLGEKKTATEENYLVEDEGVVFALLRDERTGDIISYLVNSSSYHLFYTVSRNISGEDHLLAQGTLEYDTKVRLVKLIPSHIEEAWDLRVSLLFWNHSFFKPVRPLTRNFKIDFKELRIGTLFIENDYFDEQAVILDVYSFKEKAEEKFENIRLEDLQKLIAEKESKQEKPVPVKAKREPDVEEVDLHIETIVENSKGMSNGEILEIQMSRFKTALETAIIHRTRRIVFIHGIGNGKLKYELRRSLERNYPDLKFQDASFKEYGYGATMVIIP